LHVEVLGEGVGERKAESEGKDKWENVVV